MERKKSKTKDKRQKIKTVGRKKQWKAESGKEEQWKRLKNRYQISDVRYQEKQGQRNSKRREQKSFLMYLLF